MGTGVELFPINEMFCIQVGSRDIVVLKHILFLKHFKDVDDYFIKIKKVRLLCCI